MYEQELTSILDRLMPFREVTHRARPSDPWFDKDCLEAKRLTWRLERAYRATCRKADIEISAVAGTSTAVRVAKDAWYAQRRNYRELCQRKRSAFWCDTVETDRKSPRSLWRSVNQLLGRGQPPESSAISVDEFSRFFNDKVNAVRLNTAGALKPFSPTSGLVCRCRLSVRSTLTTSSLLYLIYLTKARLLIHFQYQ